MNDLNLLSDVAPSPVYCTAHDIILTTCTLSLVGTLQHDTG